MSIRIPNLIVPTDISNELKPLIWHSLHCELITPMYGGGVESTIVDTAMPIRASSIRGQLRFWWRLLAKHKWDLDNIPSQETALWGGMASDGDNDGTAGQVLLKVTHLSKKQISEQDLIKYDDSTIKGLRYVLFPAYNETDESKKPHKLLRAGITWQLQFAFSPLLDSDNERKKQVIETLQWWANFGGLGFRSRKGLGAIYVSKCDSFPQICKLLTADDVAVAKCRLAIKNGNNTDATKTLQTAVQKLSDFRQAAGMGRNEPSDEAKKQKKPAGRSRWPEPDALRRIQKNSGYDRRHEPVHSAGNVFARAAFGLPILFHSHQEKAVNATVEPSFGDRLASPLILRPRLASDKNGQKQWQAMALVLPYEHILAEKVNVNGRDYPIWQDDSVQHIKPIHENNGKDPLDAFLNYFVK